MAKKLVLAVIDAMKPAMLERAIATGRAPTLGRLIEQGQYTDECVAAFPSVTPVCAASIATGTGPADHEIPAMNWWHRGEERYVEYGTSFPASRAHGMFRSLQDTVYNMNLAHLSQAERTVFEHQGQGGTLVVPGHGYLSDEHEVVEYRDMVVIVRDRIRALLRSGATLEQVKAARPTADYDTRYGATTGPWTTDMFVEAVYRTVRR